MSLSASSQQCCAHKTLAKNCLQRRGEEHHSHCSYAHARGLVEFICFLVRCGVEHGALGSFGDAARVAGLPAHHSEC